jgi:hypothetical protein
VLRQVERPEDVPRNVRAIVVADTHLDAWPQFGEPGAGGVNRRLLYGTAALRQAAGYFAEHGAVAAWHLGDVLHTGKSAVSGLVLDVAFPALAEFTEATAGPGTRMALVLVGNHEQPDRDGEHTALRPVEQWRGTLLVDRALPFGASEYGRRVVAIPYDRDVARLAETVRRETTVDPSALLLMHAGISGGAAGSERDWFLRDEELSRDAFGPQVDVLSGHYHRAQERHGGRLVYVGAALQHTFGEVGNPGTCLLLDVPSGVYCRLPLAAPEFRKLELRSKDDALAAVNEIRSSGRECYVWVVLPSRGKLTEAQARTLFGGLPQVIGLRVDDCRGDDAPKSREAVVTAGMTDGELVRRYVELNRPPFLAEGEDPASLVELGTRYLGGAR